MGLDTLSLKFLVSEKRRGVSFAHTLTLGRQSIYASLAEYNNSLRFLQTKPVDQALYADDFFKSLGATRLDFLDASDYEGANLIHDLNQPLPAGLFNRWDCVFDGGTLEHIFNFPEAIKNCLRAVKVGGHFISIAPCNNFAGHGFYQFSPELFYRLLCRENGFEVERLLVYRFRQWYQIADSALIGARVEDFSSKPTNLFVSARKIADVDLGSTFPQEYLYTKSWSLNSRKITSTFSSQQSKKLHFLSFLSLPVFCLRALKTCFRRWRLFFLSHHKVDLK